MTTRDTLLPGEQLAAVVTSLYADAARLGWETLPLKERTRTYSSWVEDVPVGGILKRYMTPEAARAWIKDGPMKEYSQARRGVGRYARFGRGGGTTPSDVVAFVLGVSAVLVPGSEGVKPLHCLARRGNADVYLTWGEATNFRNLLWAALTAAVNGTEAHIVVMEQPGRATTTAEVQSHKTYAAQCGLSAHHMREKFATAERVEKV